MRNYLLPLAAGLACCWTAMGGAAEKEPIALFNGKDLAGWEYFLVNPDLKMADVWSVKDGVLICKGDPVGYLATEKSFKNFKLVVQWRWAPGKEPGNSGVLLRITGKPMMLPKCVEAQLQNGNAGDIWAFHGFKVEGDAERFREAEVDGIGKFMGVAKKMANEKKPGEWNEYEITMQGGNLTLEVNGKTVNECRGCDVVAGKIGLQSEGGEIHFRTVKLLPLDD